MRTIWRDQWCAEQQLIAVECSGDSDVSGGTGTGMGAGMRVVLFQHWGGQIERVLYQQEATRFLINRRDSLLAELGKVSWLACLFFTC